MLVHRGGKRRTQIFVGPDARPDDAALDVEALEQAGAGSWRLGAGLEARSSRLETVAERRADALAP